MSIQDQTARSVQSDLDLHCPQKGYTASLSSIRIGNRKDINFLFTPQKKNYFNPLPQKELLTPLMKIPFRYTMGKGD